MLDEELDQTLDGLKSHIPVDELDDDDFDSFGVVNLGGFENLARYRRSSLDATFSQKSLPGHWKVLTSRPDP